MISLRMASLFGRELAGEVGAEPGGGHPPSHILHQQLADVLPGVLQVSDEAFQAPPEELLVRVFIQEKVESLADGGFELAAVDSRG